MNYQEALQYLNSFLNYEQFTAYRYPQAFSLDRMGEFLRRLKDPHRFFKSIHVAGTKGKGSTCAFTASLFTALGRRVGLYTSPHLFSFRERIQVDGEPIREEELADLVSLIEPLASRDLTFFEVTTACAFLHFARRKVEVAVVEVGLGGRLDATNVLTPLVAGMTPVSFDHMEKLGHTLGAIAREKAGIIKPQIPVVTAPQPQEALSVLKERALQCRAPLHLVEEEVKIEEEAFSPEGSRLSFRTPCRVYPSVEIPLLGRHQWMNAALALRMVELAVGQRLPPRGVAEGFHRTQWPGRCQLVRGHPSLLLDGAQNAASSQALRETVEELFPGKRLFLILGVSLEKDLKGIARVLGPWPKTLILTKADVPRAQDTQKISEAFTAWEPKPLITETVAEAIDRASGMAGPEDLVVVTGSLFVVAEALQLLQVPATTH